MGAVLSTTAVYSVVRAANTFARRWIMAAQDAATAAVYSAVRATKNYAPRWLMAAQDNAAATAGWSGLPEDLLVVCTSWCDTYNTFRLRALKQAPCLFYACDEYGPNHAAMHCPSIDATFRVPFPGPPHEKRGFVFSCHGLVFAADEAGNPYLFNPITGVQAALPPLKTMRSGDDDDDNFFSTFYDDDGKHAYTADPEDPSTAPSFFWARDTHYSRVAISTAAEVTECTVLVVHRPECRLSYARPGDKRWTLLSGLKKPSVADVLYNEHDGLFYILLYTGSILSLDLNEPTPSLTMILRPVLRLGSGTMYLALVPSGELLQVWRMWAPVELYSLQKDLYTYQTFVKYALEGCIDLAGDHDNQDIEVQRLDDEVITIQLLVLKVDIRRQKLLELRDIGDNALFLGFNGSICLPTKDFSGFEPNCAYFTDDCEEYNRTLRKDRGLWNIKKRTMENIDDGWACFRSCHALPAPIWIRPRF